MDESEPAVVVEPRRVKREIDPFAVAEGIGTAAPSRCFRRADGSTTTATAFIGGITATLAIIAICTCRN